MKEQLSLSIVALILFSSYATGKEIKIKKFITICLVLIVSFLCTECIAAPAIVQLTSPADFAYPSQTVNFDDATGGTVANTRYLSQGVEFSRDDGYNVTLYDWEALSRTTTSNPNVLATVGYKANNNIWSLNLNAAFSYPVYEMGAFFGNDQADGYNMTLSVYDESKTLIGFVSVLSNYNTSVDQYIGLRSDTPFYYARFEDNVESWCVAIDDLTFSNPVPEPASALLIGAGLFFVRSKRRQS